MTTRLYAKMAAGSLNAASRQTTFRRRSERTGSTSGFILSCAPYASCVPLLLSGLQRRTLMMRLNSKWMMLILSAGAAGVFATQPLQGELLEKTKKVGGATVQYKVVLPTGYDSAKAYPAILALGGGPQTMNTVDSVLNRNLRAEAEKRGYIVIAPAAPDGQLFFEDGARIYHEFF